MKVPIDFGAPLPCGLTLKKVLEAVRLAGGECYILDVGPTQHADLLAQVDALTLGTRIKFGRIKELFGIPVMVREHMTGAKLYGRAFVTIECTDWRKDDPFVRDPE